MAAKARGYICDHGQPPENKLIHKIKRNSILTTDKKRHEDYTNQQLDDYQQIKTEYQYPLQALYRTKKPLLLVAPLLWINLEVQNNRYQALIDSAASVNLISSHILQQLPHLLLTTYKIQLQGIAGYTTLNQWYLVHLPLPNGRIIPLPMVLDNTNHKQINMILGMPFLQQIEAEISMRQKVLKTNAGNFIWGKQNYNSPVLTTIIQCMGVQAPLPTEEEELMRTMERTILSEKGVNQSKKLLYKYRDLWNSTAPGKYRGIEFEFHL